MSQHQAASGQFDRAVNSADGVGSLKHGSRTHPAHAEGHLVYNGADWDGQNGNPGVMAPVNHMMKAGRCPRACALLP